MACLLKKNVYIFGRYIRVDSVAVLKSAHGEGVVTMRQVRSEKSNVAWFTLAECVSRGERERALGVYRLLSHSLHDAAVVAQLEGDLLWAFSDKTAVNKYLLAATYYQADGRFREALTVLEYCLSLEPTSHECKKRLVELAHALKSEQLLAQYIPLYIDTVSDQETFIIVRDILDSYSSSTLFPFKIALLLRVAMVGCLSQDFLFSYLEKVIQACMQEGKEMHIQRLLGHLEHTDANAYQEACRLLHV